MSFAAFSLSAPAVAGSLPQAGGLLRVLGASVTAPVEWDGVWNTVDSVYFDCATDFAMVSADVDTICGGETMTEETGSCPLTCTGSATATTLDMTCTGVCEVMPDCVASFTMTVQGTRTNGSYRIVTTIQATYSGTNAECPTGPTCMKIVSYGTRTGPAPAEYCLTSTRHPTWGQLKILYR